MGITASVGLVDGDSKRGGSGGSRGLALAIELLETAAPDVINSFGSSLSPSNDLVWSRYSNFNIDYYSSRVPSNTVSWVRSLNPPSMIKNAMCEELKSYEKPYSEEKSYRVQTKPLFSAFHPMKLSKTVVRSLLLCYLPVLENYVKSEEEDEEEEEDHDGGKEGNAPETSKSKPFPDLIEPGKRTFFSIFREVTITTYRNILERVVSIYFSARIASKLTKDYCLSARRKYRKGIRGLELGQRMALTSFRGNILFYSSVWIFQYQITFFSFISNLHTSYATHSFKKEFWIDAKKEGAHLGKKALAQAVKGSLTLVTSSAFVGLGSSIKPGAGSWIGFIVGEIIGYTVIPKTVDKYLGLNQF